MSQLKARMALLTEPATTWTQRWPRPSESVESAAAFLRSRRPGASRESERQDLFLAFYPLPAHTLSKAKLRQGSTSLARAQRFLDAINRTQQADKHRYFKALRDGLMWARVRTQQMLDEPSDRRIDSRRRIDGWGDHLRETVNVLVLAEANRYEPPSVRELIALAVLQGSEPATGSNRDKAALLVEKWKKTRGRALRQFRKNHDQLMEAHRQWEHRISLEILDKQEQQYAQEARRKAEQDREFADALLKHGALIRALRTGGRVPEQNPRQSSPVTSTDGKNMDAVTLFDYLDPHRKTS